MPHNLWMVLFNVTSVKSAFIVYLEWLTPLRAESMPESISEMCSRKVLKMVIIAFGIIAKYYVFFKYRKCQVASMPLCHFCPGGEQEVKHE